MFTTCRCILEFHSPSNVAYQIRTELAGEISVGPWISGPGTVDMLSNPPTTLIHNREEKRTISALGAFPRAIPRDGCDSGFALAGPGERPFTSSSATRFSEAPLCNIILAKVYCREGQPRCKGLLFEYRNGAQQALGDCRFGVDPCRTYENPRSMCTFVTSDRQTHVVRELRTVEVQFADVCTHGEDEEWNCFEMKGTLRFWFTSEECHLETVTK